MEPFRTSSCRPEFIEILPAFPGPVLLAETAALFWIFIDCPAVNETFPPAPASGAVPIERLWIPPDWPVLSVPDIEIVFAAVTVIFPPWPLLLVPLLI